MPHRKRVLPPGRSVRILGMAGCCVLFAACSTGTTGATGVGAATADAAAGVDEGPVAKSEVARYAEVADVGDGMVASDAGQAGDALAADLPTFVPKDVAADAHEPEVPDVADTSAAELPVADAPMPGTDAPQAADTALAAPWQALDNVSLVIIAGDSVAAGFNASSGNGTGGQGYAKMVYKNHAAWPNYTGHDVVSTHPKAVLVSVAKSGAQSGEALSLIKGAIGASLPKSVNGDVLLLINVGGNDFNDSPTTMISSAKTATMVQALRKNVADMVQLVRKQYEALPAKRVMAVVNGVHDPTDGKGTVPPNYTAGFCKALNNPALPMVKDTVLANLGTVNAGLKAEAFAQGAEFVDLQAAFQGHGVNSGSASWIDKDCVHPTNPGHDLIRRKVWLALTGKEY
ncbi:MAG: SGNH/GDSL hydrolase family protein [Deltaproteobacteria bacterium]|nr:SGNH/GDSL hydrolase family protein [Deltaproteobacteria bacterium]